MTNRRVVVGAISGERDLFALARTLRDAGCEVVLVGGSQTAEQLIRATVAEDAEELVVCADDEGMARLESVRREQGAEHIRLTVAGDDKEV